MHGRIGTNGQCVQKHVVGVKVYQAEQCHRNNSMEEKIVRAKIQKRKIATHLLVQVTENVINEIF